MTTPMTATPHPAPKPSTPRRSGIHTLMTLLRSPGSLLRSPTLKRARPSSPPSPHATRLPTVVLQTYSASTESIVLTALPTVPFRSYGDLLAMPREQLEDVVRVLNEKLPRHMRIGLRDAIGSMPDGDGDGDSLSRMPDAEMRRRVGELFGVRETELSSPATAAVDVAQAPNDVRRACDDTEQCVDMDDRALRRMDTNADDGDAGLRGEAMDVSEDPVVASSPRAMRARSFSHTRARGNALTPLAALKEEESELEEDRREGEITHQEDEAEAQDEDEDGLRACKRRRVSLDTQGHTFVRSENPTRCVPTAHGSWFLEDLDVSASPLLEREDSASSSTLAMATGPRDRRCSAETAITDPGVPVQFRDTTRRPPNKLRRRRSANVYQAPLERRPPIPSTRRPVSFPLARTRTGSSAQSQDESQPCIEMDRVQQSGFTPDHPLGRSQSEHLPRLTEAASTSNERPRYRFTRRKTKSTRTSATQRSDDGSVVSSPCSAAMDIGVTPGGAGDEVVTDGARVPGDEGRPVVTCFHAAGMGMSNTLGLTSAISFFTPRAKALSLSSLSSVHDDGDGDESPSPMRFASRDSSGLAEIDLGQDITEGIWMALE
ncbi:hypothetical protein ID866_10247, partial [Astraeus odoratus]